MNGRVLVIGGVYFVKIEPTVSLHHNPRLVSELDARNLLQYLSIIDNHSDHTFPNSVDHQPIILTHNPDHPTPGTECQLANIPFQRYWQLVDPLPSLEPEQNRQIPLVIEPRPGHSPAVVVLVVVGDGPEADILRRLLELAEPHYLHHVLVVYVEGFDVGLGLSVVLGAGDDGGWGAGSSHLVQHDGGVLDGVHANGGFLLGPVHEEELLPGNGFPQLEDAVNIGLG